MIWLNGITDSLDISLSRVWEVIHCFFQDREACHAAVHRYTIEQMNSNKTGDTAREHFEMQAPAEV